MYSLIYVMDILKDKIVYIYGKSLIKECNRLPTFSNRASIVNDLIQSYGLLQNENVKVVQSLDATESELKLFHSTCYINFLKKVNDKEYFEEYDEEQLEYGLGYDCPILERHYDLVKTIAGGSISAAKLLAARKCNTVINWFGGWHHAQRDGASGFCYVNDIVLAIQFLTSSFKKILYIDLDIHHGDGVQNAFEYSNQVLTLSFHKLLPGFFPGTGQINEIGSGKGKYYTLNVPLVDGISDISYTKLFSKIFPLVLDNFKPEVLVVQCGADGLVGDPLGESNLTLKSFKECIQRILDTNLPALFLGGGGYNFANTARLWTYLMSIIIKIDLNNDIPDTTENFSHYKHSFELQLDPSFQKDANTDSYLDSIIKQIETYCAYLSE